jgi:TRAP-type mannitol/chloroaromatic compound transport system permease small subunit
MNSNIKLNIIYKEWEQICEYRIVKREDRIIQNILKWIPPCGILVYIVLKCVTAEKYQIEHNCSKAQGGPRHIRVMDSFFCLKFSSHWNIL